MTEPAVYKGSIAVPIDRIITFLKFQSRYNLIVRATRNKILSPIEPTINQILQGDHVSHLEIYSLWNEFGVGCPHSSTKCRAA
jgi:hypothetical protein